MYISTFTYGNIPIEFWELPVILTILVAVFYIGGLIKRKGLKKYPYYNYFLWGLWAKIMGGIVFGCIYLFYYGSGDTNRYYECGLAFYKLLHHNPVNFFHAYIGGGTTEIRSLFNSITGYPLWYIFSDDKTRFVVKLVVPLLLCSGGSYFITTIFVSIITYGGLWKLYELFCRYFKADYKILALGILFMPSVIFWGSGIMKDSFTLAAICYFIVFTDRIINSKGNIVLNIVFLLFTGYIIVSIKPYILLILLPGTLVWLFYDRLIQIRNRLLRVLFIPFIYIVVIGGSLVILQSLDKKLGKFSLGNALETAAVIQHDLKQDYYEGNSFDIGELDPTFIGVISKFPQATAAGLFRPFVWESENIVMFVSGLENLVVLLLTLIVIFRTRLSTWKILITNKPILLYSLIFSILFAFMVGLTTSNFGSLVRYRIPLIPLYMSTILIFYAQIRSLRITQKKKNLNW